MCTGGQLKKIEIAGSKITPISFEAFFDYRPYEERAYIFDHVYQQVNDKFYVADLQRTDWKGYKEAYQRFLPHINNNYDFAEMLSEMLGELNASHTGARFGAGSSALPTATLGVFYDESYKGAGLKIKEILAQSPFTQKKTDVKAGCIIEKIDGKAIEANADYFTDLSKVSDAGNLTKAGIYKFLDKSERVVVVVDCENSDPYKLYATLNNLNQEALLNKICKIILYDDIHTTSAWKILERFTQIPIEHVLIERIKENKSLVDIRLTTGTCREYYQNNVDSFILVSSDSDYWGLISAMPEVRFFVMVESEKCSPTIKNALINAGISYCYIDDFCAGNSNDIKVAAVLREVRQKLDQAFHLNVRDILDEACRATRADMTTAEKNQFYDKYIKTMHVDISPNGEATIVLGK